MIVAIPSQLGSINVGPISGNYDADAILWAAQVVTNGGTVTPENLSYKSALLRQLKILTVWDLIDDAWAAGEADSDSVQPCTSLKQRRLGVVSGTVGFVNGAIVFNGGIIQTGFIPSSHAVAMTGTNMRLDVWETSNASSGYTQGAQVTSTRNNSMRPRSGGVMNAALNGSATTGPSTSDASGFSGVSRNGSGAGTQYFFWKDGVAATTGGPFTPASTGTVLTNIELYLGAFNNAGSLSTPIAGRTRWHSIGATLTAQQWADFYSALTTYFTATSPGSPLYTSNVNDGGIPIGNDSTGLGTIAAPYLTYSVGYVSVANGGRYLLNGPTATPAVYTAASAVLTVSRQVTIEGVNSRGAKIASGTGTSVTVSTSPTLGQTLTFKKLIVDAASNTAGTALRGLDITSQTVGYYLNLSDVLITGWSGLGQGLSATTASARCLATLSTTDLTASAAVRGAIHMTTMIEGGLIYNGGTITLDKVTTSGFGGIVIKAQAAGVICNLLNVGVSLTLDPTLLSTGLHEGIWAQNIRNAVLDGNGKSISVLGAPASRQGTLAIIATNLAGDATELPVSGGIICNYTGCSNTTNGGSGFQIGDDGQDKTKAVGLSIVDCDGSGNAAFAAGGGHCFFAVNTTTSLLTNPEWTTGGIGIVDKRNSGLINDGAVITDMASSYIDCKGTADSIHRNGHYKATGTYNGTMLVIETDVDPGGSACSNISALNNIFEVDGATGIVLVNIDVGSTFTLTGNEFRLTSGSLAANPFRVLGVNYPTFAAFNAAYPGNTANFA